MMHIQFAKRIWPHGKSAVAAYEIPKNGCKNRKLPHICGLLVRNQLSIHCDGSRANNEIYK